MKNTLCLLILFEVLFLNKCTFLSPNKFLQLYYANSSMQDINGIIIYDRRFYVVTKYFRNKTEEEGCKEVYLYHEKISTQKWDKYSLENIQTINTTDADGDWTIKLWYYRLCATSLGSGFDYKPSFMFKCFNKESKLELTDNNFYQNYYLGIDNQGLLFGKDVYLIHKLNEFSCDTSHLELKISISIFVKSIVLSDKDIRIHYKVFSIEAEQEAIFSKKMNYMGIEDWEVNVLFGLIESEELKCPETITYYLTMEVDSKMYYDNNFGINYIVSPIIK